MIRFIQLLIYFTVLISFIVAQEDRDTFVVFGNVFLQDELNADEDHSGVTITIKNLLYDPPEYVTSGTSNEDGSYLITVDPGYYLIEWTKEGYVPWEIGDVALAQDFEVENITLVPGSVLEVAGEVSGNWTNGFQYWVTEDITIPEGETLTIDAGVRVKFFPGTGLVANGTLEVNGTEDSNVLFTSKNPTPLPGDWDNVELYGENNIISHLEYEWADNGFTGDGANSSLFDNLYINSTLSLSAVGVYLDNSNNMTFTNNSITVGGGEILYCSNASNSTFTGNTLTGSGRGLYANNAENSVISNNIVTTSGSDGFEMDYCHNCLFDSNTVLNRPVYGILSNHSSGVIFQNNELEVSENGIYAENGDSLMFDNNTITEFREYGIYFQCSENSTITNNHLTSANLHTYDGDGCFKMGIRNTCDSYATVTDNYVNVYQEECSSSDDVYGMDISRAELIDGNEIYAFQNYFYYNRAFGIVGNNTPTISNNYIFVFDNSDNSGRIGTGILANGEDSNPIIIENNTIIASYESRGIEASNATVRNNTLIGGEDPENPIENGFPSNSDNHEWAFYLGSRVELLNNTAINFGLGIHSHDDYDNLIENNYIEHRYWGLEAVNSHGEFIIKDNEFVRYDRGMGSGDWFVYATNMDNIIVKDNIFINESNNMNGSGLYFNNTGAQVNRNLLVTSHRGIEITNQAGSIISQNTIISTDNDNYGIHISNLSSPGVYSNIIQGFGTGIYADNELLNTELRNNNLWMISGNDFEGSALPPLIGNYVSENINGDDSDIYGNISMDPFFTNEYIGDYTLTQISPCINAGTSSILDPDGTSSDIGAFYYHIYMVLEHAGMPNTIDTEGPYTINTTAYSTSGEEDVDVSLFYTTNGGADFTELIMDNTGGDNFTVDIPGQVLDTRVEYYFVATDGENNLTEPFGAPENMYYFDVTLVVVPSQLSANANNDGTIDLSWTPTVLSEGELINQQLFRTDSENGVTTGDFYSNLSIDDFTFTDTDTNEGSTYTYRLMGSIDIEGEVQTIFISEEVTILSDDATIVYVDGFVTLENETDFSDVLIEFERTSPLPVVYDTVYTQSDGFYEHTPSVGIYNVNYYKYGWQPGQVPNIYLTENTEIEDIFLSQGYTAYVEGEVSGEWTAENIYYVTGDISVQLGDTLRINPGVDIVFLGDYKISTEDGQDVLVNCNNYYNAETCDYFSSYCDWDGESCLGGQTFTYIEGGVVIAQGNESNRILFTSGQPIQNPGDWQGLEVNSNGNILSYIDYEYASNPITGTNSSNLIIEHSTISNLPLNVDGIRLYGDLDNININYNHFDVTGDYSFRGDYANSSQFNYNTIDGNSEYGFYVYNGHDNEFIGNQFNEFKEYAIYARDGYNLTFSDNYFLFTPNGDWKRGIYNDWNSSGYGFKNNTVSGNTFESSPDCLVETCRLHALHLDDAMVFDNAINFTLRDDCSSSGEGIRSYRSEIYNNTIYIVDPTGCEGRYGDAIISTNGNGANRNIIYNNSITMGNAGKGIYADYADIYNNTLTVAEGWDHGDYSMYVYSYTNIYNNTATGYDSAIHTDGWNVIIENNVMDFQCQGIHSYYPIGNHRYENNTFDRILGVNNQHNSDNCWAMYTVGGGTSLIVSENTFTAEDNTGGSSLHIAHNEGYDYVDVSNNIFESTFRGAYLKKLDNIDIHHNIFRLKRFQHNDDFYGIRFENETGGKFYNNTVVALIDSAYVNGENPYQQGIRSIEYSNVEVYNNIISGFQKGIEADSDMSLIYNNNLWDNDINFTGEGLPALFGDINTVNSNGDPSDVYANIFMDPNFVLPDEDNFSLQVISPCINAGSGTDPDETTADIGAIYRDINNTEDVFGCIDETACNYNEYANQDNGSCSYAVTWFADQDGDGLGSAGTTTESCNQPNGFVSNSDDLEPNCDTNDTDDCGICAGENLSKDCNGECFGEAFVDDCGTCSEGNSGHTENSDQDCSGECFGEAYLDGCSICVGGNTELEPCAQDCNGVFDGEAFWDECGICSGGDTDHEANAELDCNGICFGPSIIDSFEGCCIEEQVDECGKCNGNDWDFCDFDDDGVTNFDQYGYGAWNVIVSDIPEDQGGRVYLSFNKSYFDTDSLFRSLESYTIERLDPVSGSDESQWVNVGNGTAYGVDNYVYEISTLSNTTDLNDGTAGFRVISAMEEGNFVSDVSYGESIDNIMPNTPTGLAGTYYNNQVELTWDMAEDIDFNFYEIYRNDELIDYSTESMYTDYSVLLPANYFLIAYDDNGNYSDPSEILTIIANLLGDLTYDNELNVVDIVALVNIIIDIASNNYSPSASELQAGDIFEDGVLNVIDIVGLVNIILDL